MDLNTTSFVSYPAPHFAPQVLLETALRVGLHAVLISDFYSTGALQLQSSRRLAVISGITVMAHSRCAEDFLRVYLVCYKCETHYIYFAEHLVQQQNELRTITVQALFEYFNRTVDLEQLMREAQLWHAAQFGPDSAGLCARLVKSGYELDCSAPFRNPVRYDDTLLFENLLAVAIRHGFELILEKRAFSQCNGMYEYLGLRFYACDTEQCVQGSGFPGRPLGKYHGAANKLLLRSLGVSSNRTRYYWTAVAFLATTGIAMLIAL